MGIRETYLVFGVRRCRTHSASAADPEGNYSIGNGVIPHGSTAAGYGGSQTSADDMAAEGKAQNGRIEFTIVEGRVDGKRVH